MYCDPPADIPGIHCPFCGSRDINERKTLRNFSVIYIELHCTKCGKDYKEGYAFTGIEEINNRDVKND